MAYVTHKLTYDCPLVADVLVDLVKVFKLGSRVVPYPLVTFITFDEFFC